MSASIRSAIQRRTQQPLAAQQPLATQQQQPQQQQQQIPQNRVIQAQFAQPPTAQFGGQPAQFGGQPPQLPPQPPQQVQKTAQDTFNLVFSRLNALDKNIRDLKESGGVSSNGVAGVDETTLNGIVEEFNSRTEILAGEIADLKDMLLKLQTFTFEVNQKLFLQMQQQQQEQQQYYEDAIRTKCGFEPDEPDE
jgi:hypothetical protein